MNKTAPPDTKDEEESQPPHHYDKAQYKKVVKLIEQYQAQYGSVRQLILSRKKESEDQAEPEALDHLARTVVREANRSSSRLNLMDDSVLHVVIARGNTDLALRIIGLPEVTRRSMLDHPNYYSGEGLVTRQGQQKANAQKKQVRARALINESMVDRLYIQ